MGDIGPVRRHFEVLSGAGLAGPSLERLAQVAGRRPGHAADGGPRHASSASPPPATGPAGERDDTPSG